MELQQIKQNSNRSSEIQFHEFLSLFNPSPVPLDRAFTYEEYATGPDDATVTSAMALSKTARESDYLRQFNMNSLRTVLEALEIAQSEAILPALASRLTGPPERAQFGRSCRELRFLYHFACIVRWRGYPHCPADSRSLTEERKRISKQLLAVKARLVDQLEDQPLIDALNGDSIDKLAQFIEDLTHFSHAFETVKPCRPRNRDRDNTVMRGLVEELAKLCYRVYENCSVEILRTLFSAARLDHYLSSRDKVLHDLMLGALDQKITDYEARIAPVSIPSTKPRIARMPPRKL